MAYLSSESLHTLPGYYDSREPEPSSILFPRGPQWTRRYQRTPHLDRLNDCFVYTDQGPPMYRLLGAHYNMYKIPVKTDYHFTDRSCHFELRQYNAPNYRNEALTFPPGPPPAQVAVYDQLVTGPVSDNQTAPTMQTRNNYFSSIQAWDKYRYLPGPPTEKQMNRKF
ncbi:unnamed protein product [Candidula unifasciata]|uniref:Uncharacterized protein n=1 Tax=Candidula unifasciata TaxID=100452 RepID=A0A8S4A584_9EUPU|nr:unnamed protein product [Candidula unifasciata]